THAPFVLSRVTKPIRPLRCDDAGAARTTGSSTKKCSGGHTMAKFLVTASYTAAGLKGLQKDKVSGRREAVRQACESVGGKLEAFYLAFGEDDVFTVADLPDRSGARADDRHADGRGGRQGARRRSQVPRRRN